MNIRNAILAAADHIERNPKQFNFGSTQIPHSADCGSPGCALGWIGVFTDAVEQAKGHWSMCHGYRGIAAVAGGLSSARIVDNWSVLGIDQSEFYSRMDRFVGNWKLNAKDCATGLRLYADKYHPAEPAKPIDYPDWNAMATGYVPGETSHA